MITTQVEIKVSYPATMGPVEWISICIIKIEVLIVRIEQQYIGIHIVSLRVGLRTIVRRAIPSYHVTIFIKVECITTFTGIA